MHEFEVGDRVKVLYDDGVKYLGTVKHHFSELNEWSVRYALSVMCWSARIDWTVWC